MIKTPSEVGFRGALRYSDNGGYPRTFMLRHSSTTKPCKRLIDNGTLEKGELLWYHPDNATAKLFWIDPNTQELYEVIFIRSPDEGSWVDELNRNIQKQEFLDSLFDYIDNGGDKEVVKEKIKQIFQAVDRV